MLISRGYRWTRLMTPLPACSAVGTLADPSGSPGMGTSACAGRARKDSALVPLAVPAVWGQSVRAGGLRAGWS